MVYNIGQKVFYNKILAAIGLDKCHSFYSSAAPIGQETLQYLLGCNIKVRNTFAMAEAASTTVVYQKLRLGSVGHPIPGCKVRLVNTDANGNGEVCLWGRNVMMGYLNRKENTMKTIDKEGWLHSGNIGYIDDDGYLFIGGKYIDE